MKNNMDAEKIRLKLDELEQVSGGAGLEAIACDYYRNILLKIRETKKKISVIDTTTELNYLRVQNIEQDLEESVNEMIAECQMKTGILLPNPLHDS